MTGFWLALAVALPLTGACLPLLRTRAFVDQPNERSSHVVPTPRGGGLPVLLAVVVASAVVDPRALVVVLPAVVLGALGLVDDIRSLSPYVRLVGQLVVAGAVAVVVATQVGTAGVPVAVFVAVATVAVVAYINAFNFMDGVNGIAALNAAVVGGWFAWLGSTRSVAELTVVGAAAAGAALGFLPWNLSSRVFMGDVGSYGLGALFATGAVLSWGEGVPVALVVVPFVVYLADTGWTMARRARARESLTVAHRDHVYQRLVSLGWSHAHAACWSAGLAASACLAIGLLYDDRPAVAVAAALAAPAVYLVSPRVVVAWAARRSAGGPAGRST